MITYAASVIRNAYRGDVKTWQRLFDALLFNIFVGSDDEDIVTFCLLLFVFFLCKFFILKDRTFLF